MIFWNVIAGCANLFLLIFCFHLFFSLRGNRFLNRLLMVSFLARAGQDMIFMLINVKELVNYPYLLKVCSPISFAAPACFYLYIRCFAQKESRLRKGDWKHFILPALILIESIYTLFFSDTDARAVALEATASGVFITRLKNGLFPVYYYYFARHALFILYLFLSWAEFKRSGINRRKNDIEKKWLMAILVSTSLSHLSSISLVIAHWGENHSIILRLIPGIITLKYLALLGFIIYLVHQPQLLYNYLLLRGEGITGERQGAIVGDVASITEQEDAELPDEKLIRRSKLPADLALGYQEMIEQYMENEQPFLKSNFQMLDLAKDLDIPSHHCSYVINNQFDKNFRDWVNAYRVQFFIHSYPQKSSSMTVDGVAFESGFNSASTFYRAFKKETGQMPLTYFKDLQEY